MDLSTRCRLGNRLRLMLSMTALNGTTHVRENLVVACACVDMHHSMLCLSYLAFSRYTTFTSAELVRFSQLWNFFIL